MASAISRRDAAASLLGRQRTTWPESGQWMRRTLNWVRIERAFLEIPDDILGAHSGSDINERKFAASIDRVDVAIESINEIKTIRA